MGFFCLDGVAGKFCLNIDRRDTASIDYIGCGRRERATMGAPGVQAKWREARMPPHWVG
ncbi:MAG: hypothetical protein ACI30C_07940 [Muribaculaceae bacterium]